MDEFHQRMTRAVEGRSERLEQSTASVHMDISARPTINNKSGRLTGHRSPVHERLYGLHNKQASPSPKAALALRGPPSDVSSNGRRLRGSARMQKDIMSRRQKQTARAEESMNADVSMNTSKYISEFSEDLVGQQLRRKL